MNANELIEAIRDAGATTEMKKLIIPAMLLALVPAVASADLLTRGSVYMDGACMQKDISHYPAKEAEWIKHDALYHDDQVIMHGANLISLRASILTYELAKQKEMHWVHTHPGIWGTSYHLGLAQQYMLREAYYRQKDNQRFHPTTRSYMQFAVQAAAYEYPYRYTFSTQKQLTAAINHRMAMEDMYSREQEELTNNIESQFQAHWHGPRYSDHKCTIWIRLAPNGQLLGKPDVIQYLTGSKRFANKAVKAIEKAAPFEVPAGLPYSYFDKSIHLNINGEDM
jgi:hypothetical protein